MEKEIKDEVEKEVENKKIKRCCGGRGNVFFSIVLISIGIILLLNNFGLLTWNVWHVLWRFWPVILVFWGIETVLGRSFISNIIVTIIGLTLGILIIAYSISLVDSNFDRWARNNYPIWGRIKGTLPQTKQRDLLFECSPFDGNCTQFFGN
jgi:hypothetical protein